MLASELRSLAGALMDLAEVLNLAERTNEALLALKEAAERFDLKENVVSAMRAVALQDQIYVRRLQAESDGAEVGRNTVTCW